MVAAGEDSRRSVQFFGEMIREIALDRGAAFGGFQIAACRLGAVGTNGQDVARVIIV